MASRRKITAILKRKPGLSKRGLVDYIIFVKQKGEYFAHRLHDETTSMIPQPFVPDISFYIDDFILLDPKCKAYDKVLKRWQLMIL